MNVLSLQSHVCYGHVGNSAAVFPMQRLGIDVWPVNTVEFSNHPGYGGFKGKVFEPEFVEDLLAGIDARGVLLDCDGVLSGYLGNAGIGEAVVGAVGRVKAANPAALYCCDPVIGDVAEGVYVRPGVPELLRERAVPVADLLTPNHFELEHLTGQKVASLSDIRSALRMLSGRGPQVILVTSLRLDDTPDDAVDLMAWQGGDLARLRTPLLPSSVHGAGDAMAALFLVHFLRERDAASAMAKAGSSIFGLVARTAGKGSRELLLVEAQEEFVNPTRSFRPERV